MCTVAASENIYMHLADFPDFPTETVAPWSPVSGLKWINKELVKYVWKLW